jgi:hypothetical protein
MKLLLSLFCAALLLFAGCASYFDDQNVAGGEFAKTKTLPRESNSLSVLLLPGSGLDTAYSVMFGGVWSKYGPCRLGSYNGIESFAYLEFGAPAATIKSDFFKFYSDAYDTQHKFRGVDSIVIVIHFEANSLPSYDTLFPTVLLFPTTGRTKIVNGQVAYYMDDSIPFADTLRSAPLSAHQTAFSQTALPLNWAIPARLCSATWIQPSFSRR